MDDKWNKKYGSSEFVYGREPNSFLKENLHTITSGNRILSLGEGEGRNAIFLLKNGFKVTAIDQSIVGLNKATRWALELGLHLDTICDDLKFYPQEENQWDAIINIFAHMYPDERIKMHHRIEKALKVGGVYILEAYTVDQLQFDTGGPKELDLFMSLSELKKELSHLHFEVQKEHIKEIREGIGHFGKSAVVSIIARKLA
ncbi:MAG: hypothetical protein A2381_05770 [Bdellovibrionales bacterium RIFOXYB1_FULL_37_110]|nr:MAG: hypothetical protein A2417_06385 [Bdellovibrionales bacterium RIFOXYC1_FULL_37_79]OFZ58557.1 MAG: hypothetical protein A2381_05770 [Bdellovibrionales bacterium RIFOXYB1_FULL_37_110]OFZ63777.1 MAG: hypothetical protein A2577_07520 [Bdellovibrionales bacterium RIFOXYD1_FULL_36_51]